MSGPMIERLEFRWVNSPSEPGGLASKYEEIHDLSSFQTVAISKAVDTTIQRRSTIDHHSEIVNEFSGVHHFPSKVLTREHARITWIRERAGLHPYLIDLHSTHGTWVKKPTSSSGDLAFIPTAKSPDWKKLDPQEKFRLEPGCTIRFGREVHTDGTVYYPVVGTISFKYKTQTQQPYPSIKKPGRISLEEAPVEVMSLVDSDDDSDSGVELVDIPPSNKLTVSKALPPTVNGPMSSQNQRTVSRSSSHSSAIPRTGTRVDSGTATRLSPEELFGETNKMLDDASSSSEDDEGGAYDMEGESDQEEQADGTDDGIRKELKEELEQLAREAADAVQANGNKQRVTLPILRDCEIIAAAMESDEHSARKEHTQGLGKAEKGGLDGATISPSKLATRQEGNTPIGSTLPVVRGPSTECQTSTRPSTTEVRNEAQGEEREEEKAEKADNMILEEDEGEEEDEDEGEDEEEDEDDEEEICEEDEFGSDVYGESELFSRPDYSDEDVDEEAVDFDDLVQDEALFRARHLMADLHQHLGSEDEDLYSDLSSSDSDIFSGESDAGLGCVCCGPKRVPEAPKEWKPLARLSTEPLQFPDYPVYRPLAPLEHTDAVKKLSSADRISATEAAAADVASPQDEAKSEVPQETGSSSTTTTSLAQQVDGQARLIATNSRIPAGTAVLVDVGQQTCSGPSKAEAAQMTDPAVPVTSEPEPELGLGVDAIDTEQPSAKRLRVTTTRSVPAPSLSNWKHNVRMMTIGAMAGGASVFAALASIGRSSR